MIYTLLLEYSLDVSEIIKYFSPVAILVLIWSIIRFIITYREKKSSLQKEEKKRYLLDLHSGIITLKNDFTKIITKIAIEIRESDLEIDNFRNEYSEIFNIERSNSILTEFSDTKKEEIYKKALSIIKNGGQFSQTSKTEYKEKLNSLLERNLNLKKDTLMTVYSDQKVNSDFLKLTSRAKDYLIGQISKIDTERDKVSFFNS